MQTREPEKKKMKPKEIISLDVGEEGEESAELDPETTLDLLEEALEENYAEEVARHTNDPDIQEDFETRQDFDTGRRQLDEQLEQHHSESPELAAGDIDAAWDESDVGDEMPGGTAPTPDQDVVDEIGEAVGLTYDDDEPLGIGEKMTERDQHRWELDPESAEEEEESV